jgi:penicillin-binding protein 1A
MTSASREKRWLRGKRRWAMLGGAAALLLVGALAALGYALSTVPRLPELRAGRMPSAARATTVYTADGKQLARLYRENRTWVRAGRIASSVKDALVATEDRRFYEHGGVDLRRVAGAAWSTLRGDREGASTITMQLARNLYPKKIGRAPALRRKTKEMLTAIKMERQYAKREILEMYLNTVAFGYNAFGIEAAAQTYFGARAARLGPAQAALLVGMLKGPSRYNPVRHPERARERRNVVLRQMAKYSFLEKGRAERLQQQPLDLDLHLPGSSSDLAPHFAQHVRARLQRWADTSGYDLYADGLRVHTTLDSRLQRLARRAVAEETAGLQAVAGYEWSRADPDLLSEKTDAYERARQNDRFEPFAHFWQERRDLVRRYVRRTPRYRRLVRQGATPDSALHRLTKDAAFMDSLRTARTRPEAGLVSIEPGTGYVKTWVGGRDFERDQYDHVALARRQPGSTFKPFVYAAAVDEGYAPGDRIRDVVRTYRFAGGERWRPRNAHGSSGRRMALRDGLAYSVNTVTAKLMAEVGPSAVARTARRLGVRSELDAVPSLALGTSPVSLLELTSAYATLANNGRRHPPVTITRIEDADGEVIARFAPDAREALNPYTAYATLDMMRGVIGRGTGSRIRWQWDLGEYDLAGKTGTTQRSADGWFLLMHPQLVTGAWVGFNDQNLTFRSDFWGQGGHNALALVGSFYRRITDAPSFNLSERRFRRPPGYREPEPHFTSADSMSAPPNPLYDRERYAHARSGVRADSMRKQSSGEDRSLRPAPVQLQRDTSARGGRNVEAHFRRRAGQR